MTEMTIERFPFKVGPRVPKRGEQGGDVPWERRLGIAPQLNDIYLVEPVLQVNHVSREHFLIDFTQGKFGLTDRGSMCGTTVNGKTIGGNRRGGHTELHDQDEIAVGGAASPFVFKFHVEF